MKIKSRNILRKAEAKALINDITEAFGNASQIENKKLEYIQTDDKWKFIFVDGEPLFIKIEGKIFPTVKGALKINPARRKVVVDAGAVKFVVNGADIMGPGVVESDTTIQEGDLVIIVEKAHGKALAIGRAIVPGNEMVGRKGKVVKSIHYVGDKIWELQSK